MYAVLFAVGSGAFVYSWFMKRSNDPKGSTIAAAAVGVIAFFVFFTVFNMVTGS